MDSEDECFAAPEKAKIGLGLTQHNELGVGNTLLEEFRLENDKEFKQFL